jgi:hypothetical protein
MYARRWVSGRLKGSENVGNNGARLRRSSREGLV